MWKNLHSKIWHSRSSIIWCHHRFIFPTPLSMHQTPFVLIICLFLSALLWVARSYISRIPLPTTFQVRQCPKTGEQKGRSQGIYLPHCPELGCGSAISQNPPGSLLTNGPDFWVLVTPSPPIPSLALGVIEVSRCCHLWVPTLSAFLPSV